jgi:hypothetical protein
VVRSSAVTGLSSARASGSGTPLLCTGLVLDAGGGDHVVARVDHVTHARTGIELEGGATTLDQAVVSASRGIGIHLLGMAGGAVTNNRVSGSGQSGIRADAATQGVLIRANDARGNGGVDCVDDQAPTDNTWTHDLGDEAAPAGICQPD